MFFQLKFSILTDKTYNLMIERGSSKVNLGLRVYNFRLRR